MDLQNQDTRILYRDMSEFDDFFLDTVFEDIPKVKSHTFLVLEDRTKKNRDLLFTTDGLIMVSRGRMKWITPYREVEIKKDALLLYHNQKYVPVSLDVRKLYSLIRSLDRLLTEQSQKRIHHVEIAGIAELNNWFISRPDAMMEGVVKAYAIANDKNLRLFGLQKYIGENAQEKQLLQCYYENKTGDVLDWRIIQYEDIDSVFESQLREHGGIRRVIF